MVAVVLLSLVALLGGTSTQVQHNGGSSFQLDIEKEVSLMDGSVRLVDPQTSSLIKNAADASAPLLQVFQVYPPVLTVSPNGTLELKDGDDTTTESVALTNANPASCSETLVVHSFAYSYGQPYIGVSLSL